MMKKIHVGEIWNEFVTWFEKVDPKLWKVIEDDFEKFPFALQGPHQLDQSKIVGSRSLSDFLRSGDLVEIRLNSPFRTIAHCLRGFLHGDAFHMVDFRLYPLALRSADIGEKRMVFKSPFIGDRLPWPDPNYLVSSLLEIWNSWFPDEQIETVLPFDLEGARGWVEPLNELMVWNGSLQVNLEDQLSLKYLLQFGTLSNVGVNNHMGFGQYIIK